MDTISRSMAFVRAGLSAADLRRLDELVESSAGHKTPTLWATWSPTCMVLIAGLAIDGVIQYWMASPCASEEAGKDVAASLFDTMQAALAERIAGDALRRAKMN